jgi:hypothetical protein
MTSSMMTNTTGPTIRSLRRLLVLLHMTVAFGWLAISAAMLLLTTHGLGIDDPTARREVFAVAAHLDDNLLADFSFMTVYTGLMLAGLTPWGYTRFWWVTVKLVLALACALGGRAVFSQWLAEATTAGHPVPGNALTWGTVLMITAIASMAWIARTKPWGQIGRNRAPAQPWAHPALWVIVILTPIADYITDLPLQAIPAAIVLGHHARRTLSTHRRTMYLDGSQRR